ncbi:sensor histidine kinase [Cysteiniphilum sp. QT6929]|uniref:sensor histidine kinase n=1 Tax=Cysteiniphilum sp. QT6929 TaxID=2975055 RepID=UPI0024B37848|nr:sensor histidine kinase [Cysteiniphilum sp. QT6929]WHN66757.1 sensor histidine kinase [Cysteiniphilum sp. QT6929]
MKRYENTRLNIISPLIQNELISDILIENVEAIKIISRTLEKKYNLSKIEIVNTCQQDTTNQILNAFLPNITKCIKVGDIKKDTFIQMHFHPQLTPLLWIILLISFSTITAIIGCLFLAYIMHKKLIKKIILPIECLLNKKLNSTDVTKLNKLETGSMIHEIAGIYKLYCQYELNMEKFYKIKAEKQLDKQQYELAKQLAHDIKSPLLILEKMLYSFNQISQTDQNSLRYVINDIKAITTSLYPKENNKIIAQSEISILPYVIIDMIKHKQLEYPDIKFVFNTKYWIHKDKLPIITNINQVELSRILSNIINNSVEAKKTGHNLQISVTIIPLSDKVRIELIDNGQGIKPEHLKNIFEYGKSFNKKNGHGLGLSNAKAHIEQIGGSIIIKSLFGKGTKVNIYLPISKCQSNYIFKIILNKKYHKICVLDDCASSLDEWQKNIRSSNLNLDFIGFCNSDEMINHIRHLSKKDTFFIIDYHLGIEKLTGLQIIAKLGITEQSIISTSDYTNNKLLKDCLLFGIKILPKNNLGVPVVIQKEK